MAWKRAFHLQRGLLTQTVGVQVDFSSNRAANGVCSNWSAPYFGTTRGLHCSPLVCGLEEFFPKTENLIEEGEKTGMLPCSLGGGGGAMVVGINTHLQYHYRLLKV